MTTTIVKRNGLRVRRQTHDVPYAANTCAVFAKLAGRGQRSFLLESADIAPVYGQLSMFCVDPMVEVIGFADRFIVRALNKSGEGMLRHLPDELFNFCTGLRRSRYSISGTVTPRAFCGEETQRTKRVTPATILQCLLDFVHGHDEYFGLYGATSYDFVRFVEDLPQQLPVTDTPYFHFFIPGTLAVYDHIRERVQVRHYTCNGARPDGRVVMAIKQTPSGRPRARAFRVGKLQCNFSKQAYEDGVRRAQRLMHEGYIFELVLAKQYAGSFRGSALGLYEAYRQHNPSPYMFYFNFGSEALLGASPEMFVRVTDGRVQTRPISGTAPRGADAVSDYEHMMRLLQSPKEKAELDMLIDLGRNDVARVSEAGVRVSDYRFVEKYARVMHTVAHVEGTLAKGFSHLDAFYALLNAGTLTGAPKVEAMKRIEELEPVRRGWYGGAVGYFTGSGRLDSGITIRAATIKKGRITVQAGATLLLDSIPAHEWQETEVKLQALLETIRT